MSQNIANSKRTHTIRKTRNVRKLLIPALIILAIAALITMTACSKDEEVPEQEVLSQQPVEVPEADDLAVEFPAEETPIPTPPPIH